MNTMRRTATFTEHESMSATIVETVAAVTGRDPLDLPVLYDVVETDALAALVAPDDPGLASTVSITFEMAGCEVEVSSAGTVTVTDGSGTYAEAPVSP